MFSVKIAILAIAIFATQSSAFSSPRNFKEPPIPQQKTQRVPVTSYIEQRLDHFDPQNFETWNMRYMFNDEHLQPGGPIFIYVGGEWRISAGSIVGGHTYDMAEEFNGTIIYTEHRYYGESHPTEDTSTENLRYLNVDQALADLAYFITEIKRTTPGLENSRVIMVGGSYAGTMVAWFRQKYPHLVNGVWSSSAPLLAKTDFTEYKEVVGESISLVGGSVCYERLDSVFTELEELIAANQTELITQAFNLCNPIDTSSDFEIWQFFNIITDEFAGLVQYHWPGDIEDACNLILSSENGITEVGRWITHQLGICVETGYSNFIDFYRNTNWSHGSNLNSYRQWIYQTCAEYGWFQTSNSVNQPFGSSFPVELFIQTCVDLYDGDLFSADKIERNVERTNVIFGGMNPEVTNVFFTQGQLDPWRPMGLQEDLNSQSPVVVIPMHSHCSDLSSISSSDTEEMLAVKLQIRDLVYLWLNQ